MATIPTGPVTFTSSKTVAQAKASTNKGTIHFCNDENRIIVNGKDYTGVLQITPSNIPGCFNVDGVDVIIKDVITKAVLDAVKLTIANNIEYTNVGAILVNVEQDQTKHPLVPITAATNSQAGLLTAANKQKIDNTESRVDTIESKIPTQASSNNQLADKNFVNSSVATNTAEYKGIFESTSQLPTTGVDKNDYAYIIVTDTLGNTRYDRYKWGYDTTTATYGWLFEYTLNNSTFTAAQWAAIQSEITYALVAKLRALPTNDALNTAFAGKVDKINGKGLSTNDYTTPDKEKLAALFTVAELIEILATKADITGFYDTLGAGTARNLLGNDIVSAQFVKRTTGGTADIGTGTAVIEKIEGNTEIVNQILQHYGNDWFFNRVSVNIANAEIEVVGTNEEYGYYMIRAYSIKGHKYYYRFEYKTSSASNYINPNGVGSVVLVADGNYHVVEGIKESRGGKTSINAVYSETVWVKDNFQVIDLTLIYGAGYEPTTVTQFEQDLWNKYRLTLDQYIEYTPGKLFNFKGKNLITTGFNQWDEEWELGMIDISTGQNRVDNNTIRSKNYIPVFPNTVYFVKSPVWVAFEEYDADKSFIGNRGSIRGAITTSANCYYVRFYISAAYGIIYKNDICINLSWSGKYDGQYQTYWKSIFHLDITTLTGINTTINEREVIFPNGMGGKDNWRSIIKEVNGATVAIKNEDEVEDLSQLNWLYHKDASASAGMFYVSFPAAPIGLCGLVCAKYLHYTTSVAYAGTDNYPDKIIARNGTSTSLYIKDTSLGDDIAALKEAINGVKLRYQLATPITYTDLQYPDGTPFVIPANYRVDDFGTEEIIPVDNEETCAPILDIKYSVNAVDTLRRLKQNFISKESMQNFLNTLSGETEKTWSMAWNDTTEKYDFDTEEVTIPEEQTP